MGKLSKFINMKGSSGAVKGAMIILALAFIIASVSYIIPVLATHQSSAELSPEWSPAGQNVSYTVKVCNFGASTHDVDEVRIYRNMSYTNFVCEPKEGWELLFITTKQACQYVATDSSYYIEPDNCDNFNFYAVTPAEGCEWIWFFESRDVTFPSPGSIDYLNDTTSVDDVAPEITKEIIGPQSGPCPPGQGEECWITQSTQINVSVTEKGQICGLSGLDWCEITYTVDGAGPYQEVYADLDGETYWEYIMDFDEDSVHVLNVTCMDIAGNKLEDIEIFRVDDTPPETTKDVSDPKKVIPGDDQFEFIEWVDGTTEITLNPVDPDPTGENCNIGVDKTWYMNVIDLTENACWDPYVYCDPIDTLYDVTGKPFSASPYEHQDYPGCIDECQEHCADIYDHGTLDWYDCVENCAYGECSVDPLWKLYDGTPIQKDEDSCHILQYFSVDHLGNIEEPMNVNCFFVDKTPPERIKTIGDPQYGVCPEVVEPELCEKWDCFTGITKDFFVTGRYGNQVELAQTWELAIWENTTSGEVVRENDGDDPNSFDWTSGVSEDFSLSYDAGTGDVVFTIGSKTIQWTYDANKAFEYIIPFVKGNADGNIAELTDMQLNGMPISDISSDMGGTYYWGLKVPLYDSNQASGFTLTGKAKLTWSGTNTKNEQPAFHVFAMNTHDPEDCWVRDDTYMEGTPITLECVDPEPHPSGDEEVCYKVSLDDSDYTELYCPEKLELIEQEGHEGEWCCLDSSAQIVFHEDTFHDLEWFCRDAVDKKSPIDLEWFRVDSLPPIIEKDMFGSYLDDCPSGTDIEHGDCYVADDGSSGVAITVYDDDTYPECTVDDLWCYFELWWQKPENVMYKCLDTDDEWCLVNYTEFSEYTEVIFHEDSTHELYIYCEDALGNWVEHWETFLVDSTPPETTKIYGDPYKKDPEDIAWCLFNCPPSNPTDCDLEWLENCMENWCTEWINGSTPITLKAEDVKVGVEKIYYADTIVDDNACWLPSQYCHPVEVEMKEVMGDEVTFFKEDEESCHVIQYYAVDKLGNEEQLKYQCVFVDNTGPEAYKDHDEPFEEGSGTKADPHYVNQSTSILLWCEDGEPHPVGQETIYWRFSTYSNGFDSTPTYSTWDSAPYTEFDVEVSFDDDCWHNLEYYCVDHLGNVGPLHVQYYIVDTVPPKIEKTVGDPKIDCTDYEGELDCYQIDTKTEIWVDAYDPQPHPVNDIWCEWKYYWNEQWSKTYHEEEFPFQVVFGDGEHQESEHELYIYCEDALGNPIYDREIFVVDKTPPEIWKEYGDPHYPEVIKTDTPYPHWISSDTLIKAGVKDVGPHLSGIKEVKYRYDRVEDKFCEDKEECQKAETDKGWTDVEPEDFDEFEFKIPDDSCHLIEIFAKDNVDKNTTHKQCVYVDNQPPEPLKEVGEPKAKWTPGKNGEQKSFFYPDETEHCWDGTINEIECWKVTMMTPITLDCVDPQPHPVDDEEICFMVDLDGCDETESYCDMVGGTMKETWCCGKNAPYELKFDEETEHNLKYYCIDALGNEGEIDEEKFKVEGTVFEIPLYKKWNLISVPFVLLDDDPEVVFNNTVDENGVVKDYIDSVWAYDPLKEMCDSGQPENWCIWTPNPAPDNLEVKPGWGYWVLVTDKPEGCEEDENGGCWPDEEPLWIKIGGSLFSPATLPPSRNLVGGWNLIGYYGTSWELYDYVDFEPTCGPGINWFPGKYVYGDKVYCALNSLIDTQEGYPRWSSLWSYINCGDHVAYWLGLNTCADPDSPLQSNLDRMYAGRGYWVELDVADMYVPATTCLWNSDFECRWTGGGIIP